MIRNRTTFLIPVWSSDVYAKQVKKQLIEQGVPESNIKFITEKISRAISLNKYINEATTEYVGIFDDDVVLAPNVVEVLEDLLDKYPNVGFATAPVQQAVDLNIPTPRFSPSTPDEQALENISAKMWTFNATIYRKSCGVKMDEDFFGSQLIDWDFGLELLHKGFLSLSDHRTAVCHKQTVYDKKNLCYHAVVARSRHIFMRKWQNRDTWINVKDYNISNNSEIPTLEEITHSNEDWLLQYIAKYDKPGLISCWFNPRFCGDAKESTSAYMRFIENCVKKVESEFNPFINDANSIPIFK